jgi:hypothetical protein
VIATSALRWAKAITDRFLLLRGASCRTLTTMMRVVLSSLVLTLGWSCSAPRPNEPDASRPEDAGFDAGLPDAGDAGEDGGLDAGAVDAGLDAGSDDGGQRVIDAGVCPTPSGLGPAFRVRAMSANLSSGNLQSYDPGHGARIMQGADPDVVLIQEFNYGTNSAADIATFVANTFDGGFAVQRGTGSIPNGIISRWPIVSAGEWVDPLQTAPNRGFTWAHIDLPGPNDLWAVSLHLLASSARVADREAEAAALIAQFNAMIPPQDYLVVGGDLNTYSRMEPAFATLGARVVVFGPYPVDQLGNEATNATRTTQPYDNVLASPCLAQLQGPTVLRTSTYPWGAVIDTRVYTPLSDLAPAQLGDSDPAVATNMQHMGVVKDFFIQP